MGHDRPCGTTVQTATTVTRTRRTSSPTLKWRTSLDVLDSDRFVDRLRHPAGTAGLEDELRSGRPRKVDHAALVTATSAPPPKNLGVTHWSSRLLADRLKISNTTVAAAWREYGVKPWRSETFKFSIDPELVAKVTDIVGLYLNPPDNAIVLCVDEKSQIQALDRTAPMLPMRIGSVEKRTHDYVRHGPSTLGVPPWT